MDENEHKYQYARLTFSLSLALSGSGSGLSAYKSVNGCMRFGSFRYDWIGQGVANEKIYNKI